MRTIEATPTFKEDLKRVCRDPGRKQAVEDLLSILARDLEFMAERHRPFDGGYADAHAARQMERLSGMPAAIESFPYL